MSNSSSDSSVIVVSDSDEPEDIVERLTSAERCAKRQQSDASERYAAAVAAVFLNTTAKTRRIARQKHDVAAAKLATHVVDKHLGVGCSRVDGNITEISLDDLNASNVVTSSVPSSEERVTLSDVYNDSNSERIKLANDNLLLTPFANEANEAVKMTDSIAAELNVGLDGTVCNELTDCLDPMELLDKCESLPNVCDGSFLGDLSFIDECFVEDCGSPQMLPCSSTDSTDALSHDLQTVAVNNHNIVELNKCSVDIVGASCLIPAIERSSDSVQISSVAVPNNSQSDVSLQQAVSSFAQNNTKCSSVLISCNCDLACVAVSHVDTICCSYGSITSVSAPTDDQSASEMHQACDSLCQTSLLTSVDGQKSFSVNHGLTTNEPPKQTLGDNMDGCELLRLSSVNAAGDVLATDVGPAVNLLLTGKRQLPDDFADVASKRFRANNDHLSAELLTAFDGETVTDNCDAAVISTHTGSYDVDSHKSVVNILANVCCCNCRQPLDVSSVSYCSDGHACCMACLQHQVKKLLSLPSKA